MVFISTKVFAVRIVVGGFSLQRHSAKRIDSERSRVQAAVAGVVKVHDLVTNPQNGVLDAVGCGGEPSDHAGVIECAGLTETAAG
jgi:hypothetical protein